MLQFFVLTCFVVTQVTFASSNFCINGESLEHTWLNYNEQYLFDHWLGYADHYEAHLPRPTSKKKQPIRMLEIGVQSGGSVRLWKKCYGEQLHFTGLDIDNRCKRMKNKKENIHIVIGSQTNTSFLSQVCEKYGPFDIVIDDGGHTAHMIRTTMAAMLPSEACMREKSVYVVEDTHTMSKCNDEKSYCGDPTDISSIPCDAFLQQHSQWFSISNPALHLVKETAWAARVVSVHLYDSMIFYELGTKSENKRITKGWDSFSNIEEKVQQSEYTMQRKVHAHPKETSKLLV